MSFTRIRYGGTGVPNNYSIFLCDGTEDISSLPTNTEGVTGKCSYGSKAYVIESSDDSNTVSTYILDNSNTWVKLSRSSSNGISPDNIATLEEIKDYLNT